MKRLISAVVAILPLSLAASAVGVGTASASSGGTVTYTATINIAAPPASSFQGAAGGDGWGLAFTATQLFNVFHHQTTLQINCHNQADATQCWSGPVTITDASGNNFATSGQPGLIAGSNGNIYVYATRSDSTAGVVCITPSSTGATFCGFTALSNTGEAPDNIYKWGAISDPVQVGSDYYAFNYFASSAAPTGTEDELMCFSLTTFSACPGQPYAVGLPASTPFTNPLPSPSIGAFAGQIIIPINPSGSTTETDLYCYDPSAGGTCPGTWPVSTGVAYAGNYGGPFAMTDANGNTLGFCLPTGADPCYNLDGGAVTPPANLSSTIPANATWNGPSISIGPRVFDANAGALDVECYDWSTDASCTNFPKTFGGTIGYGPYTVNPDPARPTCVWVNSDSGTGQIQDFDGYTGGGCTQFPIRLLAQGIVAPPAQCAPTEWTNLTITSPAQPSVYGGGSVEFEDAAGNPLSTSPAPNPVTISSSAPSASVDLTPYNFSAADNLPDFVLTFNTPPAGLTSVDVQVSWQGLNSPTCSQPGTTVSGTVTLAGPAASAPIGTSQTISATVINNGAPVSGGTVTFTCISGPCTTAAGTGTTGADGVATFTYTSPTAGTDIWQATYTPPSESAETSDAAAVVWNFVATAVPSQTTYGNSVTLGESGLPASATGTVTFTSGGQTLCTLTLTGQAGEATSCTTSGTLPLGSYAVTASYSGDAADPPSSATTSFSIGQTPTVTTGSVRDVVAGAPWSGTELPGALAQDTATVSNGASGALVYSLYSGDNCLGTLLSADTEQVASGVAQPSAFSAALDAGSYSYQAVFEGTTDYASSTSACQPFAVQQAATAQALVGLDVNSGTQWSNPEGLGSVASASAGLPDAPADTYARAPGPTGTVTYDFFDNGTCNGTPATSSPTPIVGGAVAGAPDTAPLAPGSYSYDAVYSGDLNYVGSTSSCVLLTVSQATLTLGVTPYDASTDSSWAGTEVTGASALAVSSLTNTVAGFTPTGTVTYDFYETAQCTGTPLLTDQESLSGGVPGQSVATSPLGAGTYYVQAHYSGDANNSPATSTCDSFTVNPAPISLASQPYDVPSAGGLEQTGSQAYDTATLSGVAGFVPTGSVTYDLYPGNSCTGTVISVQTVGLSSDGTVPASADSGPLAAGSYSYLASYSGDANYLPPGAQCESFSVGMATPVVAGQVEDAATGSGWTGVEVTGASAYDTATVTGVTGFAPTGTLSFSLYDNGTCEGTPVETWPGVSLGSHTTPTPPLATGTYGFLVSYGGDSNYVPTTSSCQVFSVHPAASLTAGFVFDSGTQAAWSGSETQGSSAYDTSSVTGVPGFAPSGTMTYQFFQNGTCAGTPATTGSVTLSGGTVPVSAGTGQLPPGPMSYLANYSGDSNYTGSSSGCQQFYVRPTGYRLLGADGGLFAFHATFRGSLPTRGIHDVYNVVGMAPAAVGYWMVRSDGYIYSFGSAGSYGSLTSLGIKASDIVGMASTPDYGGYWLVSSTGAVYAFGDAKYRGGENISGVVAIVAADGGGYWLVTSTGNVYTFGDAKYHSGCAAAGSGCQGQTDIVGMASPDPGGYWLVSATGGVFTFGDAHFRGSCDSAGSGCSGATDIVGIAGPDRSGYWLAGADGHVYRFGDAQYFGDEAGVVLTRPIDGIAL